jgi:hypothetical protein
MKNPTHKIRKYTMSLISIHESKTKFNFFHDILTLKGWL